MELEKSVRRPTKQNETVIDGGFFLMKTKALIDTCSYLLPAARSCVCARQYGRDDKMKNAIRNLE